VTLLDRILGPIAWPEILVPWREIGGPTTSVPVAQSGYSESISLNLLRDAGWEFYRDRRFQRWPSVHDVIARDLLRSMSAMLETA
jgi:hypothetical protein